jgi:hypothetical protein
MTARPVVLDEAVKAALDEYDCHIEYGSPWSEEGFRAAVAVAIRHCGERILSGVDGDIRSGKVRDNGWIQGVKQAADDLIRTSREETS